MKTDRITVRIGTELRRRLKSHVAARGAREADLVREALEKHLAEREPESCYDLARRSGMVGVARNTPRDLSTNPEHFEGFGR